MKLYKTYPDGDGHTYLIPKEEYKSFIETVTKFEQVIEYFYSTYKEDQIESVEEEFWALLSNYETLEGEEHFVILESDLGENI